MIASTIKGIAITVSRDLWGDRINDNDLFIKGDRYYCESINMFRND
ncbi:MAG: hypothetical protein WCP16_23665 [Pseudanabaena sp. ELA645]